LHFTCAWDKRSGLHRERDLRPFKIGAMSCIVIVASGQDSQGCAMLHLMPDHDGRYFMEKGRDVLLFI